MKRRAFLATAAGAAACSRGPAPRLNVFNWSSYVDPQTIENFTRETGIRVRYAVYESNEEMLAKIASGNSGWDVVFPTHSRIAPMVRHGLVAQLQHQLLPGLTNLDSMFQAPAWDPELQWCVPYLWNSTGIAYRKSLNPTPRAWSDLWSPALAGKLTMLDDSEDVLGSCLLKLGLPFGSERPEDLLAARAQAIAQKKVLRAYLNAEVRDQLVAGDVLAAQLWSTTAQQAMSASSDLDFVFPDEGFPIYCDNAVILAESSRQQPAHTFLNYLLRPDVAAANARVAESATANLAARRLLPASTTLYGTPEILTRGIWPRALTPAAQRLRDRIWTEIKSA